ncbi:MAG: hypothetical protein A2Y93_14890 [Chloroflexi bacterium RBG_13_68_17]|nr:MAG: hypothetical protein A2Y93_14890 [Chloroflexi bacterium RBG_13_68_17]
MIRSGFPRIRSATLGALTLVLLLGALYALLRIDRRAPAAEPAVSAGSWLQVFFSEPASSTAETLRGGPDALLAEAIDQADYSVDVAVYNFDLWSVRDALARAAQRGLTVRLVTDSDNLLGPEVQALVEAGVAVLGDRRESLMHHKFVVLDQAEVFTGSMNLTVDSAYHGDNNLLRIRSSRLAEDFTREFEEMFVDDRFGALSLRDTPYPQISIDGELIEVLFSPDDGVARRLLELVRGARERVEVMAYAFTSDDLAEALIERAGAGLPVRVVVESSQASAAGAEFERLLLAGVDVRRDGNPGDMHHKVVIIDGAVVWTGSYNFTRSAEEYNDEGVLVVHSPELAARFLTEFERVYAAAGP